MKYLSAEWRKQKSHNWKRYERRHGRRSHGETTRRCWCETCFKPSQEWWDRLVPV